MYRIDKTKLDRKRILRVSKSSIDLLRQCERKFVLERGLQVKPDFEEDQINLKFGTFVHGVLEDMHHFHGYTEERRHELEASITKRVKEGDLPKHWEIVGRVALDRYPLFVSGSGLTPILFEVEIGTSEDEIGFVDLIEMDAQGHWHIVDIKTSAGGRFLGLDKKSANLHGNLQLGTYARKKNLERIVAAAKGVGIKLDIEKFSSVRLRIVTKPTKAVVKPGLTMENFLANKTGAGMVHWHEVTLPKDKIDWNIIQYIYAGAKARVAELAEGSEPTMDENRCFDFNGVCPYYSYCFGKDFETMVATSSVIIECGKLSFQGKKVTKPPKQPVEIYSDDDF